MRKWRGKAEGWDKETSKRVRRNEKNDFGWWVGSELIVDSQVRLTQAMALMLWD